MSKRGVTGYLENKENEIKLRNLIVDFDKKVNLKSKISCKDIYEYVRACYKKNQIDFCPGLTWWKTKGKFLVDEYNEVKKKKIKFTETEQLDIVDIKDLIDKHAGNKEILLKNLKPYNDLVERMVERIRKLEENISNKEKRIVEKDIAAEKYKNKIEKYENLINNLFMLNISSELHLKHVLNYDDGNSELIRLALEQTFEKPDEFISEFIQLLKEKNNTNTNNIIELKPKENDDFEF